MTKTTLNQLTYEIIGAAIEVHKELGPGLLENIYQECMKIALAERGIRFSNELKVPIYFYDTLLETALRCDLFVDNCIVVELKAVKNMEPIFEAQLMTYMKLLKSPKGILINFNCINLFREGQKTIVNDIYRNLPD